MKKITIVIALFLATTFSYAQSQTDMNETAVEHYKEADKELNTLYNNVLKEYKSDVAFIKNLKIAQTIWIKFRDAELNAKFPVKNIGNARNRHAYGTAYTMCWNNYAAELTKQRIATLKIWLGGIEEGDACADFVKRK